MAPAATTDHVVSAVILALAGRVQVFTDSGALFEFIHSSVIDDYRELRGHSQINLHDHYTPLPLGHDLLILQPGAPSQPAIAASSSMARAKDDTDDPYVDVEINLGGG